MKKIYIIPTTALYTLASEGLMREFSTTDVTNQNSNDPNKDNGGPGVEDDNEGPSAKWFNPDWDFDPEWNFDE